VTDLWEGLPEVGEVRRLHLGPGDHLVITYPVPLSQSSAIRLKERAHAVFGPDVPVLVLDCGAELAVVGPEDAGP
jgi:hypothetical protein